MKSDIRLFNYLLRKRLLLWTATLLVILVFLGILASLCWYVRMKASYPVRVEYVSAGGRQYLLVRIPRRSFQVIKVDDRVGLKLQPDLRLTGTVEKVEPDGSTLRLTLLIPSLPAGRDRPESGSIILRSRRLLAAFQRSD